ncbi:MAG: hypothetical protein FJX65_11865 [Alphaproteobacteria bacterium]|nr:hypothetical protein [Alphaproteobacteria bacterium]
MTLVGGLDPASGFARAVSAGPLVFVGAQSGATGDAAQQCEEVYGAIARLLDAAGLSTAHVVRLDHYTGSQAWLAERQRIRARYFGRPAPLASTGVATPLPFPTLLRAAAIAVTDLASKRVLVAGATHGMPAIATAVAGGPFVFVSGILNSGGWTGELPEDDEFARQAAGALQVIRAILAQEAGGLDRLLRAEGYVENDTARASLVALARLLGFPSEAAWSRVALPFAAPDRIEVTTLAAARDVAVERGPGAAAAGGFVFAAADGHSLAAANAELQRALASLHATPAHVVRLDLAAASESLASAAGALRDAYPRPPAFVAVPCLDRGRVSLSAIAYVGRETAGSGHSR